MYLAPLFLGIAWSGERPGHFLLFLTSTLAFLAFQSFLQAIRQRAIRAWLRRPFLALFALVGGAGLLALYPALAYLLPILPVTAAINLYYLRRRQERNILNDLAAIAGMALTGPAAYLIGGGGSWSMAWSIWLGSLLYFTASVFYVKSLIRERDNHTFRRASYLYHGLLPLAAGLIWGWPWSLPFLPSLLRAILTPYPSSLTPPRIALIETATLLVSFLAAIALSAQ